MGKLGTEASGWAEVVGDTTQPFECVRGCLETPVCLRVAGLWWLYPPKPYRVRPCLLSAYTTSMAVTVFLRACSV